MAGLFSLWAMALTAAQSPDPVAADKFAIASVHRSRTNPRRLFVVFAKPLPVPAYLVEGTAWQVQVFRPNQSPTAVEVDSGAPSPAYVTTHSVTLALKAPIDDDATGIHVTLLRGNRPSRATADPAERPPALEAVDNSDDANLYFSGIVAPAAGAKTLYTIDSRVDLTLQRFGRSGGTRLGLSGELKTDERPHVDPNSARIGVSLRRVRGFRTMTWEMANVELNKEAKLMNLISAASLVQTWGRSFTTTKAGLSSLRGTVNLQAGFALEAGGNLRNAVSLQSGEKGSGIIIRAVPSVGAWFVMPATILERVLVSAEYTARIPATRELFFETRHLPDDADPVPSLTRKVRHHVVASVTFMATKWVGFEAKYRLCVL